MTTTNIEKQPDGRFRITDEHGCTHIDCTYDEAWNWVRRTSHCDAADRVMSSVEVTE